MSKKAKTRRWKSETCETCDFRVDEFCRQMPPVLPNVGAEDVVFVTDLETEPPSVCYSNVTYLVFDDADEEETRYMPACSRWAPRER